MRIYITHCSAKKNCSLKNTNKEVTPDRMYTATPTRRFMNRCKEKSVDWAIFSDLYGVWFPNIRHRWYEKNPDTVTLQEFHGLIDDFERKLQGYDEIYFYCNPGRFHPLYRKLLRSTKLNNRVKLFTHKEEIIY